MHVLIQFSEEPYEVHIISIPILHRELNNVPSCTEYKGQSPNVNQVVLLQKLHYNHTKKFVQVDSYANVTLTVN